MHLSAMNVEIQRGGRRVVAGVSFALWPGEAMVVTGPNGAGKSTLLRALAGLLPVASGKLEGEAGEMTLAEMTHYVGHAEALKNSLTAAENIDFWGAMLGSRVKGLSADAALARFGLGHVADLPAAYLSAGQRRRVSLCRLLAARRPLWLLDEPTTALDKASQGALAEIMKEHRSTGGMIVAATHAPLGLDDARELDLGSLTP
jgi:heme exporter protein A